MRPAYWNTGILFLTCFLLLACATHTPKPTGNVEPSLREDRNTNVVISKHPKLPIETRLDSTSLRLLTQQRYSHARQKGLEEFPVTDTELEDLQYDPDNDKFLGQVSLTKPQKVLHLTQRAMLYHLDGNNSNQAGLSDGKCELEQLEKFNHYFVSNCYLETAKFLEDDIANGNRQKAGKMIGEDPASNSDTSSYQAEAIEKTMLHILSVLNYAKLKKQDKALAEFEVIRDKLNTHHRNYYQAAGFAINERNLKNLQLQLDFILGDKLMTMKGRKFSSKTEFWENMEPIVNIVGKDNRLRKQVEELLLDQALQPKYTTRRLRVTPEVIAQLKHDMWQKPINQLGKQLKPENLKRIVWDKPVEVLKTQAKPENIQSVWNEAVDKINEQTKKFGSYSYEEFSEDMQPLLDTFKGDKNLQEDLKKLLDEQLWTKIDNASLSEEDLEKFKRENWDEPIEKIKAQSKKDLEQLKQAIWDKPIEALKEQIDPENLKQKIMDEPVSMINQQTEKLKSYTYEEFSEDMQPVLETLKGNKNLQEKAKKMLDEQLWPQIKDATLTLEELEKIQDNMDQMLRNQLEGIQDTYFKSEDEYAKALQDITGEIVGDEYLEEIINLSMEGVYKYDAFAQYLKGIIHEWQGDYQLALLAYNRSCVEYAFYEQYFKTPIPPQLLIDRGRLIQKTGGVPQSNPQETSESAPTHPCELKNSQNKYPDPNTHGELITVSFNGLFPQKVPSSPLQDFAQFAKRPNHIAYTLVEASPDSAKQVFSEKMFLAENLSEIAITNLDNRNDLNQSGTETDIVVKGQENQLNLDSWSSLPDQIHMSRQFLAKGDYTITVYYYSEHDMILGLRVFTDVSIVPGEKVFLYSHFAHRPDSAKSH